MDAGHEVYLLYSCYGYYTPTHFQRPSMFTCNYGGRFKKVMSQNLHAICTLYGLSRYFRRAIRPSILRPRNHFLPPLSKAHITYYSYLRHGLGIITTNKMCWPLQSLSLGNCKNCHLDPVCLVNESKGKLPVQK